MRTFPIRQSNAFTAMLVFFLTLLLAACDLPQSDGGTLIGAAKTSALDDFAGSAKNSSANNGGATSGICDATTASTILTPVPNPPRDGAPIDVRIHYNRPDGNYGDWGLHLWQVNDAGQYIADYPGVSWNSPLVRAGIDSYGAYFDLQAAQFTNPAAAGFGFIVHPPGQNGDPGVDRVLKFTDGGEFWLRSGDATVYRNNPLGSTPDIDTVRVHYKRFDNVYNQWGLHLWPSSGIDPSRLAGLTLDQWGNPVPLASMPNYATGSSEIVFDLPVLNPQGDANRNAVEFIIHGMPSNPNGGVNNKDGWNDNIRVSYAALSISNRVGQIWLVQGTPTVFAAPPNTRRVSTTDARAAWLTRNLLKWPLADDFGTFKLYHSANGQILAPRGQPVSGADGALTLQVGGSVPADAAERFKYLDAGVVLAVNAADEARLGDVLKQQLVLVQEDADGKVLGATTPQLAGALDDRYAAAEAVDDLGVSTDHGRAAFKLWAPTARKVTLCTYGAQGVAHSEHAMTFDAATGVWRFDPRNHHRHGDDDEDDDHDNDDRPRGLYYRYAVEVFVRGVGVVRNLVTDPYSISLNANSQRSYIADLDSPWLMPPGWRHASSPDAVRAQEDMSIYELHVRDFSANDSTVSTRNRGKYLAFTEANSNGMRHLRGLARAGVTDVHLLPVFDFASTCRSKAASRRRFRMPRRTPKRSRPQPAPARDRLLQLGLRPLALHRTGRQLRQRRRRRRRAHPRIPRDGAGAAPLRPARGHGRGLQPHQRVWPERQIGARPHRARLLPPPQCGGRGRTLDLLREHRHRTPDDGQADDRSAVKTWAAQYRHRFVPLRPDGPPAARGDGAAARRVSVAAGHPIQLIGEGWNFGEVANGARFVQASQLSLNGSGIGTFSDRARDAVRGGGAATTAHAQTQRQQGWHQRLVLRPASRAARQQDRKTCCGPPTWCAWAWPASLRLAMMTTHDGRRCAGPDRLRRPARGLCQPARRGGELRREPRQPDAVRHQRRSSCRPHLRETARGCRCWRLAINELQPGHRVLPRRHRQRCAASRWTATATTAATGSTASTGASRTTASAPACRRRATTAATGR
jgi:pullulanase